MAPALVLALALPSAYGLLLPGLPETADGIGHLSLLIDFDRAIRAGAFYPRWLPDYHLAYGSPAFIFYSPASFYLAELFHLLGAGFGLALALMYFCTLLASALGMYLLAGSLLGSRPGALLAALAYVYAPYHLVDVYARGAIAEAFAYAVLPFALWALWRLGQSGGPRRVSRGRWTAGGAAVLALVVVAHQLTALFFLPLALVFALVTARGGLARLLVSGAFPLAAGLSAAYWLPAIKELSFAHLADFIAGAGKPWEHLSSLVDLQQTTVAAVYDFKLGLIQSLLALAGVLVLARSAGWGSGLGAGARAALWVLIAAAAASTFMMTPASRWLWLSVPALAYLQYPFRLLVFVALGTALLAGLLAPPGRRWSWPLALIAGGVLIWSSFPNLPSRRVALEEHDLGLATLERYLYGRGPEGSGANQEYVPIYAATSQLKIADGRSVAVAPLGTSRIEWLTIAEWGPWGWRGTARSTGRGTLYFHTFFYPGWRAYVDGQPAPAFASAPLGLLLMDLPDGEHAFEVRWGAPLTREVGIVLSLAGSLVALLLVGVRRWPVKARWAGAALVVFVILASVVAARAAGVRPTAVAAGDVPLALVGYDVRPEFDSSMLTLYWLVRQPPGPLEIELIALDKAGKELGRLREPPEFGASPASLWVSGEVVADRHILPGEPEATRLGVRAVAGERQIALEHLVLPALPSSRPGLPRALTPVEATLAGMIRLVGFNWSWDTGLPVPGGARYLAVHLGWECLHRPDKNYSSFVGLIHPAGRVLAARDYYPQGGMRPTLGWQPGQRIDDTLLLLVPPGLPPGSYQLSAGMYRFGGERLKVDGSGETSVLLAELQL